MATKVSALEKFMRPPQNTGANDVKPQPIFAGFQKPSVDMEAVRDGRRAPPIVGNGTVHFQDTNLQQSSAPIYVGPGFIAKVPFTQLLIENKTAQAGKKLRIVYGTDVDFTAGVNATIAVTDQSPIRFSGTSQQTTVLTTASTLVAANAVRKVFMIQNNGPTDIYVSFGATATLINSFKVAAGGGSLTMDNAVATSAVSVIGVTATNASVVWMEA